MKTQLVYYSPKSNESMLKYAKEVLTKVSFDAQLFEKELKKAIKLLVPGNIIVPSFAIILFDRKTG